MKVMNEIGGTVFQDAIQGVAEREIDQLTEELKNEISDHVFNVLRKYGHGSKLNEKDFEAFVDEMANADSYADGYADGIGGYILRLDGVEQAIRRVCYEYKKIVLCSDE